MKLDKGNLRHWRYLLQSGLYVLLCIPLRYLLKRRTGRKTIILYGHKLHSNLLALYNHARLQPSVWEMRFLTLDPDYARRNPQLEPLLALRFRDMLKVALADCIVTDHGLHAMLPLLFLTRIRFVDVWHGVPFKGFVPASFRVQRRYHETWVSSPDMRRIYIEQFGFLPERVVVTGYGRTDLLLQYQARRTELRQECGLPLHGRIVLFAPTWKQEDRQRSEAPFGYDMTAFARWLADFAEDQEAVVLIRQHLNSATVAVLPSDRVRAMPASGFPDAEMLLAIADVLITDWSSIAFDMMVLRKPIVFLDVPAPFRYGFALGPECRVGPIVGDLAGLETALRDMFGAKSDPETAVDGEAYQRVLELAYGETLDGRSCERYEARLRELLQGTS